MQLKELLNDDKAVSPVIGVILMVAITVILAAVIGTFVLGLGDQVSQTSPQASFSFDYDLDDDGADSLEISHSGGDPLDANNVNISVTGDANVNNSAPYSWNDDLGGNDRVTAGSAVTLDDSYAGGTDYDLSGATVRVVWESTEGDQSAQLGQWSGPDA